MSTTKKSKVYFTKTISSEKVVEMFNILYLKNKLFIYKLNYVNNEKVKSIFYKNNIF